MLWVPDGAGPGGELIDCSGGAWPMAGGVAGGAFSTCRVLAGGMAGDEGGRAGAIVGGIKL